MKTNQLLVSSSMITAMCEKKGLDNLKLLEPFIIQCISDNFEIGEGIDKGKILKDMESRYAFREMPLAVLDKVLFRLEREHPQIVVRQKSPNRNQFILKTISKDSATHFHQREAQAQQETQDVIKALKDWLNAKNVLTDLSDSDLFGCIDSFLSQMDTT